MTPTLAVLVHLQKCPIAGKDDLEELVLFCFLTQKADSVRAELCRVLETQKCLSCPLRKATTTESL